MVEYDLRDGSYEPCLSTLYKRIYLSAYTQTRSGVLYRRAHSVRECLLFKSGSVLALAPLLLVCPLDDSWDILNFGTRFPKLVARFLNCNQCCMMPVARLLNVCACCKKPMARLLNRTLNASGTRILNSDAYSTTSMTGVPNSGARWTMLETRLLNYGTRFSKLAAGLLNRDATWVSSVTLFWIPALKAWFLSVPWRLLLNIS